MGSYTTHCDLADFALWNKIADQNRPLDFYLEVTARCNNNCRHCYINLPAGDRTARKRELSVAEIGNIADQAVDLGALWCLLTGGEPLLREDFFEIYLLLKKKGLLISLFTNACLITEEHISFFRKYPPRDIEVSVYGISKKIYESVSRKPGSYNAFRRGLDLLLESGIKVRLKTMAIKSNVEEFLDIATFCRNHSSEPFRFDPFLNLRYDQDPVRNSEIRQERLPPEKIVAIEQADNERSGALLKNCEKLIFKNLNRDQCNHLFLCGAGKGSFTVSSEGIFRLCSSLWHPDCVYDLRKGSLAEAWNELVPRVRDIRSQNSPFFDRCRNCQIVNLCSNCPAHAHLEIGEMDQIVPYFCEVAHARFAALEAALNPLREEL
ncbi:MAG: radical SAM protein [Desulfotignum sp.]|nr:radical SAM protein [Desulfotignum sp.]